MVLSNRNGGVCGTQTQTGKGRRVECSFVVLYPVQVGKSVLSKAKGGYEATVHKYTDRYIAKYTVWRHTPQGITRVECSVVEWSGQYFPRSADKVA